MWALLVVEEHDRLQQPDSAEPAAHQSLQQIPGQFSRSLTAMRAAVSLGTKH
jgi:hypothetical protein